MTDEAKALSERLRAEAACALPPYYETHAEAETLTEAADALDAKDAEIEALRAETNNAKTDLSHYVVYAEELKAENAALRARAEAAERKCIEERKAYLDERARAEAAEREAAANREAQAVIRRAAKLMDKDWVTAKTRDRVEAAEARATAAEQRLAAVEGLKQASRNLTPYLDWTIGPESPGYHPTMRSAVGAFKAALAALSTPSAGTQQRETEGGR